jgi:hypothetical protein
VGTANTATAAHTVAVSKPGPTGAAGPYLRLCSARLPFIFLYLLDLFYSPTRLASADEHHRAEGDEIQPQGLLPILSSIESGPGLRPGETLVLSRWGDTRLVETAYRRALLNVGTACAI